MARKRPIQDTGQFHGEPYKLPQAQYAEIYGVTTRTVQRWCRRRLPCDDRAAMNEFLSNAGRKPGDEEDKLAESRVPRLDETFLEGEGLVAAIRRLNKIEVVLADAVRDALKEPGSDRKLLNLLAVLTQVQNTMRRFEKDTPGILEQHEKQIDVGEVEEGVARLLLTIVDRLRTLPAGAMQTFADLTDPQDVREELEKEIAACLAPIRDGEWIPRAIRGGGKRFTAAASFPACGLTEIIKLVI